MSSNNACFTPTQKTDIESVVKATTPGGMVMDILLSPAVKPDKSISLQSSPAPAPLEERLSAAESRRAALDTLKAANLSERLAKVEAAKSKREELATEKSNKTKEELEAKFEKLEESRSAQITGTKIRLSEHLAKIEKAQKDLEIQTEAARLAAEFAINSKMMKAEENKDGKIEEMLKKIKEHEAYVMKVRANQETRLKPYLADLEENIKEKMAIAEKRREEVIEKVVESAKEELRKADIVRQNKAKLQEQSPSSPTTVPESA